MPLWVTEHGYPADPAYQYDPSYRGGEPAQAAYLRDSLPTLVRAGAGRIFVSTRDTWPNEYGPSSPYNSEGIASVSDTAPYSARRRPAWNVFRLLAGMWPRVPHSVAEEARLTTARDASGLQGLSLTRAGGTCSTPAPEASGTRSHGCGSVCVAPSAPTGLARCEHCAGRSGAPSASS